MDKEYFPDRWISVSWTRDDSKEPHRGKDKWHSLIGGEEFRSKAKQPRPFPAAEAPIADMPSLPALVKAAATVFLPSPLSITLLYCASLAPASESQTPWTGI